MRARLRWLVGLPFWPFTPAWALRSPETLSWRGLQRGLYVAAALGALGALVWTPLVLEALATAHPALGRLLPSGDTGRVYTMMAAAVPLFIAVAFEVSAARRISGGELTAQSSPPLTAALRQADRSPGPLRWLLPLWAVGALIMALNGGALGLLFVGAFAGGLASGVLLASFPLLREALASQGFAGVWDGLVVVWDYATLPRHLFTLELDLLDGTRMDPVWGALGVLALLYVVPTAVAVWALRNAPGRARVHGA